MNTNISRTHQEQTESAAAHVSNPQATEPVSSETPMLVSSLSPAELARTERLTVDAGEETVSFEFPTIRLVTRDEKAKAMVKDAVEAFGIEVVDSTFDDLLPEHVKTSCTIMDLDFWKAYEERSAGMDKAHPDDQKWEPWAMRIALTTMPNASVHASDHDTTLPTLIHLDPDAQPSEILTTALAIFKLIVVTQVFFPKFVSTFRKMSQPFSTYDFLKMVVVENTDVVGHYLEHGPDRSVLYNYLYVLAHNGWDKTSAALVDLSMP